MEGRFQGKDRAHNDSGGMMVIYYVDGEYKGFREMKETVGLIDVTEIKDFLWLADALDISEHADWDDYRILVTEHGYEQVEDGYLPEEIWVANSNAYEAYHRAREDLLSKYCVQVKVESIVKFRLQAANKEDAVKQLDRFMPIMQIRPVIWMQASPENIEQKMEIITVEAENGKDR